MEYHFAYVVTRTYLHVIGSGTHCGENVRRMFLDTDRVRQETQLDCLLVELRFVGPSLSLGEVYSIMLEYRFDASLLRRYAYVDTNVEHLPERGQFIELASKALGVNFRPFRTVAEAERWLNEAASDS